MMPEPISILGELATMCDVSIQGLRRLRADRNDLLAACEEMAKILPVMRKYFVWDGDEEFTEQLRAVIARVKGEDDE